MRKTTTHLDNVKTYKKETTLAAYFLMFLLIFFLHIKSHQNYNIII